MEKTLDIQEQMLHTLGKIADERGVELYAVGGWVRDYFMGRIVQDIDCTVVGDSLSFAEIVAHYFSSKAVIYERFRTALVPVGDYKLEFVGTRKEEYLSHSRKPIVSEGTLEDDLRRRDFTINAMAVSLNSKSFGKLIDIFDGQEDLEQKILRTPLDPIVTFSDDPLRMMRAARFAARLGFTLMPEIKEAMTQMADRITIISQERITDEFLKMLAAPKPSIGLTILYETGLLKYVFPEVERLAGIDLVQIGEQEYAHKDVFYHTLQVLDNLAAVSDNLWLRFATLMHDIAKPPTKRFEEGSGWTFHGHEDLGARMVPKIFARLKLPLDNQMRYVQKLVQLHLRPIALTKEEISDSAIRRLLFEAGDDIDDLMILCKADITSKNESKVKKYLANYEIVKSKLIELEEKDRIRNFQPPISGEHIMKTFSLAPGREVGIIKNAIKDAILDGVIHNDFDEALTFMMQEGQKLGLKVH